MEHYSPGCDYGDFLEVPHRYQYFLTPLPVQNSLPGILPPLSYLLSTTCLSCLPSFSFLPPLLPSLLPFLVLSLKNFLCITHWKIGLYLSRISIVLSHLDCV